MPLLAAALLFTLHVQDRPQRADCREWHECRQMALDAAAAGEYERFHDLAWRTIQTGPKNDPSLMYLLARAQSLSGRPGDALVMLQRLAAVGITTDAATNEDFRRVRDLPGWAEFAGSGAGMREPPSIRAEPVHTPEVVRTPDVARPKEDMVRLKADITDAGSEAVRFETLPFTPAGLAYDAVSRRFIVADRRARRLAVVDEFSRHMANLASAQSTGFGDIAAIEIDPREGDLWVLSSDGRRSTVHKLQLVSGRALASLVAAERFGEVEFVDVAATPDTGVLVLDRAGHRIFQVRPRSVALDLSSTLPDGKPASIAPAGNNLAYVAHDGGIWRVDLSSRSVTEVRAAKGITLANIARLRWHKGALIAVQREDNDRYRAVRIELDQQGRAAAIHAMAVVASIDPTAATISGGTLYYLASADGDQMTVRKLLLK